METQGRELERCALPHWNGRQILVIFLDEGQLLLAQVGQEWGTPLSIKASPATKAFRHT